MNGFGLDTNIISFHLKNNETVWQNIERELDAKIKVYIPPFAYYEVKRGLVAAKATKQLRLFDELLTRCPLGEATEAVFEAAVNIHAVLKTKGRICDDMDILIAAFCKAYGLTLWSFGCAKTPKQFRIAELHVTNNTRHFENIPGLALADWSAA
jgi:predicted nucleic acid-binding protein